MNRTYDLVLWGATGFTGRLVARALAGDRGGKPGLRWALGGRNLAKLEEVRRELAAAQPAMAELPLVLAQSQDRASLDRMARAARVVCTTVGPYALHGDALVAACAEAGTHYCDLTGEPPWVRRMIDAHHETARRSGARIVTSCGFDSIPSDLGVWMLQERALGAHGAPCSRVRTTVGPMRGGTSGGTVSSMLTLGEELRRDAGARRVMADPYALYPRGVAPGLDGQPELRVRRLPGGGWTGPFMMGVINERIVRRSNALLGFRYGADFRYGEVARYPAGPRGLLLAAGTGAGFLALALAGAVGPLRRALERHALPAPGEGPSAEEMQRGFFRMELAGQGFDPEGRPFELEGRVEGGEPGYGETARMLAQAALCLAQDPLETAGGVLTPASAMGGALLDRLRRGEMRWAIG